jgi:hypothetical protein
LTEATTYEMRDQNGEIDNVNGNKEGEKGGDDEHNAERQGAGEDEEDEKQGRE